METWSTDDDEDDGQLSSASFVADDVSPRKGGGAANRWHVLHFLGGLKRKKEKKAENRNPLAQNSEN